MDTKHICVLKNIGFHAPNTIIIIGSTISIIVGVKGKGPL